MEDNRPDDIDNFFKDGLQPLRRRPSKAVWEKIERELDKDDRRIFIVRLRFALLVAACLLTLVGGLELYFHTTTKNLMVTNKKRTSGSWKSAAFINDTTGKVAKLSLPTNQIGQAGPALYSEKDREDEGFGFTETRGYLPEESSHVSVRLQSVASGFQSLALDPTQRCLMVQLSRNKKASSTVVPQPPRRWAVTGFFSSEFAGYNLTDRDSIAANGKEIDKKEKHVLSSSAMILINYRLSENWVFETGLGYSWAKSHASPTTSYAVNNNGEIKFQVNTLSGYGYVPASSSAPAQVGDSVAIEHSTTTLHYLNAPFILSYAFHFKRLTLMPGIGFSLNLLTGAALETKLTSTFYSQQDYIVKMYGIKRLNYGLLLKTELGYAIDPHWSLDMVASFKNALTPINLHTLVATYPYNLGIGAGIKYSF
jgi:hypothetical protein